MPVNLDVYGTEFLAGELSNTKVVQPIIFNKNCLVRAIRTTILLINAPTFTNLKMNIYGASTQDATTAQFTKKIYTSTNFQNLSDLLLVENNGYAETYFQFNDVVVQQNTLYALVLSADSYTYSANSFLAWYKDNPQTVNAIGTGRHHVAVISADL